jgi:hypothetical protein
MAVTTTTKNENWWWKIPEAKGSGTTTKTSSVITNLPPPAASPVPVSHAIVKPLPKLPKPMVKVYTGFEGGDPYVVTPFRARLF